MNIKQIQKQAYAIVEEYNKKHNLKHHPETVFHHLVEEVGELGREISKESSDWRGEGFSQEKLGEEIADVLFQLLYLSRDYNIDLEKAVQDKIKKLRKRFELDA